MNIIDILILAVLGVSLIFGLYRGFISLSLIHISEPTRH